METVAMIAWVAIMLAALIGTIVLYYMCYFSLRDENKN